MRYSWIIFSAFFLILFSCKEKKESVVRKSHKEIAEINWVLERINKNWVFYHKPINNASKESLRNWIAFRQFLMELAQKPKTNTEAFQKKAAELAKKASDLGTTIPLEFDCPQIRSRINSLVTKVELLNLYINLENISDKKVIHLIGAVNEELAFLQRNMDRILLKNKISIESGETEMLKMLDTSRIIPNTYSDPNILHLE